MVRKFFFDRGSLEGLESFCEISDETKQLNLEELEIDKHLPVITTYKPGVY